MHRAGASGPTLRGSGWISICARYAYSGYENFKFKVPVAQEGDVFARYMCRVAELRESNKIVQQALDGMPEGPIKANAPGVVLRTAKKMKTQMEALIYHFKIITEDLRCRRARYIRRWSRHAGRWDITS